MSFLGLKVNHETARLLGSIPVPGTKVPLDHMHVTVLYLGDNVSIKLIAKAVIAAFSVTSHQTPFNLKTSRVKCFPVEEDQDSPIIARILSPELHEFRAQICKAFDKNKIPYCKTFTEYKPHVTLSFNKEPIKDQQLPECISWAAHEATLFGGDYGDDKISIQFPFTLKPMKENFYSKIKKHPNK